MKKLTMSFVLAVLFLSIAHVEIAGAVIFDDQFDDPALGSGWTVEPGRGDYSLTDHPGYLRYIIDAQYVDPLGPGYAEPLFLIRPFSGQQWTLATRITYDMRPGSPTNNRWLYFFIRKPNDFGTYALMLRGVGAYDANPGSNTLVLRASENGAGPPQVEAYFPNSPGPLPPDTIFYQVERDCDHFVIGASTDGDDSTFEYELDYTFSPGEFGNEQEITIAGGGWHGAPGGYADIDFITAEPIPEPSTILLVLTGMGILGRRKFGRRKS